MSELLIPGLNTPLRTIFCIGRNYIDHAKELNNPVPSSPIVFLKPHSSICFNNDTILIPPQSKDVHHEVELVVALSKSGKNIPKDIALDYIEGVGVGIDFTARDIQQKAKESGHPWSIAKGFDTFSPISTFIPFNKIEDIQNIDLQLYINNVQRQSGNTHDMIFSVAHLISFLSDIFTLHKGDIIFTGTPSGVSQISSGDTIQANLGNDIATLSLSVE